MILNSWEQFDKFIKNGLGEFIGQNGNKKLFLDLIENEFDTWGHVQFRLDEGDLEYYEDYVVSCAENFENVLTPGEIEEIRKKLLLKWEQYGNAED